MRKITPLLDSPGPKEDGKVEACERLPNEAKSTLKGKWIKSTCHFSVFSAQMGESPANQRGSPGAQVSQRTEFQDLQMSSSLAVCRGRLPSILRWLRAMFQFECGQ